MPALHIAPRPIPQADHGPPDWVDTPTAVKITTALALAQAMADVVVIYGGGGVGKTFTARHYATTTQHVWCATMTPATAGVVPALEEVCTALGVAPQNGAAALQRAIVKFASGSHGLLIVDEAQHLQSTALDQLRCIYDAAGIGLALLGSRDVYARVVGSGGAAALDRLRSRIGRRVALTATTADDVAAFAGAAGIEAQGALKVLEEIATKAGGLRSVAKVVRLAHLQSEMGTLSEKALRDAWRALGGV